jgi:hypothetical protein
MLAAWDTPQGADMDVGHGRIEARLGQVGQAWGETEIVSRDGEAPVAAVGADGTAAIAWTKLGKSEGHEGRTSIYVSIAAPGRRFAGARLVASSARLSDPEGLEVLPGGEAIVIWSQAMPEAAGINSTQRKYVDFALVGTQASAAHSGVIAVGGDGSLSVAETEQGAVLVAYPTALATAPSPTDQQAAVAALPAGATTFAQPQVINAEPGNPGVEIGEADVAAGPGGGAFVFADKVDELEPSGVFANPLTVRETPREIAERKAAERESLGAKPTTGPIDTEAFGAALPADGARVMVWQRTHALTPVSGVAWRRVMVAVRPAGAGAFSTPVRLSSGAGLSGTPKIATAGGATLVLWTQNTLPCKQRVYAAVRPAGGVFAAARAISGGYRPAANECYFGNGELALAGSDRYAIAGWAQNRKLRVAVLGP